MVLLVEIQETEIVVVAEAVAVVQLELPQIVLIRQELVEQE
tara:strand:- start:307 stop:429 length:123 start_codon:yes stop_codon:yes gene_type:complete